LCSYFGKILRANFLNPNFWGYLGLNSNVWRSFRAWFLLLPATWQKLLVTGVPPSAGATFGGLLKIAYLCGKNETL